MFFPDIATPVSSLYICSVSGVLLHQPDSKIAQETSQLYVNFTGAYIKNIPDISSRETELG
jgi:hypothetical protein